MKVASAHLPTQDVLTEQLLLFFWHAMLPPKKNQHGKTPRFTSARILRYISYHQILPT